MLTRRTFRFGSGKVCMVRVVTVWFVRSPYGLYDEGEIENTRAFSVHTRDVRCQRMVRRWFSRPAPVLAVFRNEGYREHVAYSKRIQWDEGNHERALVVTTHVHLGM